VDLFYVNDVGGTVFAWRSGRTLEDELFFDLSDNTVDQLLTRAIELHGSDLIDDHIKSASRNATNLNTIQGEYLVGRLSQASRSVLAQAAQTRRAGWFKSVTWMEDAAREIIGPSLSNATPELRQMLERIFDWARNAC
jgi:hypothetical protein